MKPEIVPRKCSTCIRKGCCKGQKKAEESALGRCSRQYTSRRAVNEELIRLKIAHLRRMAKASADLVGSWPSVLASIPPEHEDANSWRARWIRKHMALQSACLAKITELKESQCSTKS